MTIAVISSGCIKFCTDIFYGFKLYFTNTPKKPTFSHLSCWNKQEEYQEVTFSLEMFLITELGYFAQMKLLS